MRAAVCAAVGGPVSVERVILDDLGPDQVRVKVGASGVCHTDLSAIKGWTGLPMPLVLGHEGAGTIIETGKNVTRCKVGDRVVLSWMPTCGTCWHCVRHETQHCEHFPEIMMAQGVTLADGRRAMTMAGLGTFSEVLQTSELSVVPVKSELPFEQLAMIGCGVTTGVGAALWTAKVPPGATVAVFGLGGVGLSVVQGARIAGAVRIFAVDPIASKRKLAQSLGATDMIDPAQGDVALQLIDATGGRGVDYAFEVVGNPSVALQAYNSVRKRGTAVIVGMPDAEAVAAVPLQNLFLNEKRLIGSLYGSAQIKEHFPLLVAFAEHGKLALDSMISARYPLDDISKAIDSLSTGEPVRSIVLP